MSKGLVPILAMDSEDSFHIRALPVECDAPSVHHSGILGAGDVDLIADDGGDIVRFGLFVPAGYKVNFSFKRIEAEEQSRLFAHFYLLFTELLCQAVAEDECVNGIG